MFQKLKRRLVWTILVVVTLILAAMNCFVYLSTYDTLRADSDLVLERALQYARNVNSKKEPVLQRQIGLPYFTMEIDRNGRSIAISAYGITMNDVQDPGMLQKILTGADDSGTIREWGLRFLRETTKRGSRVAVVDVSSQYSALNALLIRLVLVSLIALALFFGLGILLAEWITRPTRNAFEQQRRFIADASHDLKTPTTVILSNAELLLMDQEDPQPRLELIHGEALRMRDIIAQLLNMARLDHAAAQPLFEAVDLSAVLTESLLTFELPLLERGLSLKEEIPKDLLIYGNAASLQQLFDVLLDNACRYTPAGGSVELRLFPLGRRRLRLIVHNSGSYLTKTECAQVFDRFFRIDRSRGSSGSVGLGLSIAKSVAQAHHGTISAVSSPVNGTDFILTLPCKAGISTVPVRRPKRKS